LSNHSKQSRSHDLDQTVLNL